MFRLIYQCILVAHENVVTFLVKNVILSRHCCDSETDIKYTT